MAKDKNSVPASPQVEADVLGSILAADKDEKVAYWRAVNMLSNEDPLSLFHGSRHQILAKSIMTLLDKGRVITDSSIVDQMEKNGSEAVIDDPYAFINSMMASSSISNINTLRESIMILVDNALLRKTQSTLERITDKLVSGDFSPNEIATMLKDASSENLVASDIQNAGALIDDVMKSESAAWTIPTGIDKLDSLIGGLEAGRVYCIAARPKIGKTTMATSITINSLESGAAVISVSMELPPAEWAYKLMATTCFMHQSLTKKIMYEKQPVEDVIRNSSISDDPDDDIAAFNDGLEGLRSAPLYPLFPRDIPNGFQSIVASIIDVKAKHPGKPIILVIDYLQLMIKDAYNQVAEISWWTRALKLLAMEESISIIMLSQLNREGATGEMPTASQFRGSGSIEQDIDAGILLNRKSVYNEENDWNEPEHIIDINVALNRAGRVGTFQALWDGACNIVSNLDEDDPHNNSDDE